MQIPKLAPIESKKQSLQEWHAAGGGVPLQYKGREHVWHAKVKKFAEGGEARMGAGGLLKGIVKGAQKVLPAAEREANLAKMLEGSKVKERLYHGTKAHDDYAEEAGQAFGQFTGKPTWLAKEPYTASGYSAGTGSTYAVHAQVKKPLALRFDANDSAKKAFPVAKRFGVDIDHMVRTRKPERAWEVINDPAFIDAVEAAGHDGLSIAEDGYKTYGVFDPRKIKSATGNRGTYDTSSPDLSKAKGGEVHMAGAGDPAFYPRVGNIKSKNFKPVKPPPLIEDPRAMNLPQFGDVDLSVPTKANLDLSERIAQRDADLKRQQQGDRSLPEKIAGVAQAGRFMGSALTQAVNSIPTRIAYGDEAADKFMQERLYKPEQPTAYEYVDDVGNFLQRLETEYKIPPVLPEATALQSVVGPAASQAKKAVGSGALSLAQSDAAYNLAQRALASPALAAVRPMNVIKPTGGNFLTGRTEKDLKPLKARGPTHRDEALLMGGRFAQMADDPESIRIMAQDAALNKWVDSNLTNYVKKQMGTPDDPVRKLAEEGITHKPGLLEEETVFNWDPLLKQKRAKAGFSEEGMGQSPTAQAWERASDKAITTHRAGDIQDMPEQYAKFQEAEQKIRSARQAVERKFRQQMANVGIEERNMGMHFATSLDEKAKIVGDTDLAKANAEYKSLQSPMMESYIRLGKENPWISKVNPETPVYTSFTSDLGFDHIMDVLREDLTAGRIRPEQMNKISISDAVRRTSEYDRDLAAKMNASRAAAREGLPTYREYPEGYKWIQLNKPGSFAQESEAMGHSVRGYEPPKGHPDWSEGSGEQGSSSYGHGGWEAIKSGKAKVYSLVDSKGAPHATVEVKQIGMTPEQRRYKVGFLAAQLEKEGQTAENALRQAEKIYPEESKESISQIKGKGNRAPNEEYLPYIQDFVRGSKWSDVRELQNAGLSNVGGRYFTEPELVEAAKKYGRMGVQDTPWEVARQRHIDAGVPEEQALENWVEGFREGRGRLDIPPEGMAKGGAVHMAGGGDRVSNKTLSDLIKEDASVSKTDPRGEMKAYDPTIRERMADALQRGMEGLGGSRYKSRRTAQTFMGGPSSNAPMNLGFADAVPFLGTALGVDEGARNLGHAYDAVKRGDYIDAAANTVGAAAGLIPGAASTIKGAKAAGRGALAAGRAGARFADRAVPKIMERGGPGAEMLQGMSRGTVSPLDVYHGTPYKFDRFDASKIGTGEGNQAYGHGLYFAENPAVSESYQKMISIGKQLDPLSKQAQKFVKENMIGGADNDAILKAAAASKNQAARWDLEDVKRGIPASRNDYVSAMDEVQEFLRKNPIAPNDGSLYKVDLPDEQIAKMLDWDKPLSEQPDVMRALKGTDYEVGVSQKEAEKIADMRLRQEADEWAEMTGGDPVDYSNNVDWEKYVDGVRKESGSIDSSITGKDLHRMVMRDEGYRPDLFDSENYQVGASETLRGMGIPGIKYLDATSRDAGKGTRNFVTFPGEEHNLTILERNGQPMVAPTPEGMARGGAVRMAGGGLKTLLSAAKGVPKGVEEIVVKPKVDHPLVFPRATPKTKEDIRPIAQRMAEQVTGDFVRQNPKLTTNPAGKSRKQYNREQEIPLETRNLTEKKLVPFVDYALKKGNILLGVPGDPTLGGLVKRGSLEENARPTVELTRVGDITPDSPVPLFGGPRYGDEEKFWASNYGAALPIQNNATELAKLYEAPVLGQYIKMAPGSENFAVHNLDALLAIQQPEKLSKSNLRSLNSLIKQGSLKYGKFPGFAGFEDPIDVLLQAQLNPKLRKHIAETLTKPTITESLGLSSGLDVVAAITHPELRNLETGVSGFSIGEMRPGSNLRQFRGAHPTYDTDIPGAAIGQSRYPIPAELAFPDTTAYARSQMTPGVQEFNMIKLLGPRERIDQQYIDEIKMYEELMKQYTGKKKGGAISKPKQLKSLSRHD